MKYHFIKQETWNDCGFACLAMLIDHFHHQQISIRELKHQFYKPTPNGLSFFDLQNLGKQYKLNGEGYQCDFQQLINNQNRFPLILNLVNHLGLSHYVILNKINENFFWITDPSQNKKEVKMNYSTLEKQYLGKIFIFKRQGKLKTDFQWSIFWKWTKINLGFLSLLLSCSLLENLTWFFSAFFIKSFSKWMITNHLDFKELLFFILLIFIGIGAENGQTWIWQKLKGITWQKFLKILINDDQNNRDTKLFWAWKHFETTCEICWNNLSRFWYFLIAAMNFLICWPWMTWYLMKINILFLLPPILLCFLEFFYYWKTYLIKQNQSSENYQLTNIFREQINLYLNHRVLFKQRALSKSQLKSIEESYQLQMQGQNRYYLMKLTEKTWTNFSHKFLSYLILLSIFYLFKHNKIDNLDLIYCLNLSYFWFNLSNKIMLKTFYFWSQKQHFREFKNLNRNAKFGLKVPNFKKFSWKNWTEISIWNWPHNFSTTQSLFLKFSQQNLDNFFLAWESNWKFFSWNDESFAQYNPQIFYLDSKTNILPGLVCHNLFWNQQNLTSSEIEALNLDYWLKSHNLDLMTNCDSNLSLKQKQLISFLNGCCLEADIYLFNNCLTEFTKQEQSELMQIFLKRHSTKFAVFGFENLDFDASWGLATLSEAMV